MATKQQPARTKHIPQRTCVSCRRTEGKRALVRLVRTAEGRVAVDPSGKQAGRGAYLCARQSCWDQALKRQTLSKALRAELQQADREALAVYAERFAASDDDGDETAS